MPLPASVAKLQSLNVASDAEFIAVLGSLYENSAWVADRAAPLRPFMSMRALHDAMIKGVREASADEKIALLRAHPELAGKEAIGGTLTPASASEQSRLGLDRLDHEELARLTELNRRYRRSFDFPCIIALRWHQTRDSVFASFEERLGNGRETEIENSLAQIEQIVRGRLATVFNVAKGRLSTHVLDTAGGMPASGMDFELSIAGGVHWQHVLSGRTNAQGRTDAPLLTGIDMTPGSYRLRFAVADYFRGCGMVLAEPAFLDFVPIEFGIADPADHYHVPLLCTPWSYSTYRGS